MSWKNKETYEKIIAKTFFSLAEEMAEEEIKRLKLENQKLREQLLLHNVSQQRELLPNMTLEQAIEKAKPNLDKIKDLDKHIDNIR
jgi:regulator of replication initiation timing